MDARSAKRVAMGALLFGLALFGCFGCGDFTPHVGPRRDAAAPDCAPNSEPYGDAGTGTCAESGT